MSIPSGDGWLPPAGDDQPPLPWVACLGQPTPPARDDDTWTFGEDSGTVMACNARTGEMRLIMIGDT